MTRQDNPYTLHCRCGHALKITRTAQAKKEKCSECREFVFVFPTNPLAEQLDRGDQRVGAPSRGSRFLLPTLAAGVTLLVVVVTYGLMLFTWKPEPEPPSRSFAAEALGEDGLLSEARQMLRDRQFRLSSRLLQTTLASAPPSRALRQLRREADLLAHLSPVPLEDIIRHAQLVGNLDEWNEQFQDYRGRTVLFDDVVRRQLDGTFLLTHYDLKVEGDRVALVLDLKLLQHLPLNQPRRLLFGAALKSVSREQGGTWTVRFDPESGVLMTDPEVVIRCGFGQQQGGPEFAELELLLREQRVWALQQL